MARLDRGLVSGAHMSRSIGIYEMQDCVMATWKQSVTIGLCEYRTDPARGLVRPVDVTVVLMFGVLYELIYLLWLFETV